MPAGCKLGSDSSARFSIAFSKHHTVACAEDNHHPPRSTLFENCNASNPVCKVDTWAWFTNMCQHGRDDSGSADGISSKAVMP